VSRVARSGWSRIAYSIAGTIIVAVTRCSSTAASQPCGLKLGITTNDPPFSSTGSVKAPAACDSGAQTRNRTSCGHCHSVISIWVSEAETR